MTIPQAKALLTEMDAVDGHRDAARMMIEGILDIACALTGTKRPSPASTGARPSRSAVSEESAGVLIPELRNIVETQLLTEGWQPPAASPSSVS